MVPQTYKTKWDSIRKRNPLTVSYLNSLENKSDRMGLTIGTKYDAVIHISFYDFDPFPQVVCAEMILDYNTPNPFIRSITAMMRKNVTLRTFIENETIAYLEDRNEKIQAEAYSDYQNAFNYQEIN